MSTADSRANVDKDEDFDDLDDVLEQFKVPPTKPVPLPPASSSQNVASSSLSKSSTEASSSKLPGLPSEEDVPYTLPPEFAAEFADEMERLMRELSEVSDQPSSSSNPAGPKEATDPLSAEQDAKFRAIWEQMLVEGMNGEEGEAGKKFEEEISKGGETSFQKAIQQTMDKLKDSDAQLKPDPGTTPDQLAALLSGLSDMNLDGNDEAGMEGMLEEMMGALMSKEILYEPVKELDEQLGKYLLEHPDLSAEDKARYDSQRVLSRQITAVFEKSTYRDDDPVTAAELLKLMNEMQSKGSPPKEVLGPLPPGLDFGEGLPGGEGCIIA
ncbi:hypothetical protein SISSUDRAFT_1066911 [Sistotremastrum suecicum HHB10207 ss-3]|uniref:Pex19-domain-containing protein n=1 Tax=Sistotremastrum suecicum HHB10207 ss-3 TaxID=1314776 RepID=A0A165XQZ0_9AGAM|nr:hypothetical protein SISSUDRAFT_1066911 [Sistotremastrum suecicum HHB10207 ss-3]